jgi:hypothetical protein
MVPMSTHKIVFHHKLVKAFVGFTGPELAAQETMYGFVMALIFITSAQFGLIYGSPLNIVMMIISMNFVWGSIDMYIFYRMDITAQKRYTALIRKVEESDVPDEYRNALCDDLGNTIFDAVDESDKNRAVDLLLNSKVQSRECMKADRWGMLMSAIACLVITLLTTVPIVLCLLLIGNYHLSLTCASIVASVSLFFAGYLMEPSEKTGMRVLTGISIAIFSLLLTLFAMLFGG